jgi:transposase
LELGFERAEAAETGRPDYGPRDLLKLYLYGYVNQIRSSRRLEAECRRNVELMRLLMRLYPDHKSIAEFRRMHREAVTAAGAEPVQLARSCGLIRGEWIAIDGTKFRAVASADSVRERQALEKYLDSMEKADEEQHASIDPAAVQAALDKLEQHLEPEAGFMKVAGTNRSTSQQVADKPATRRSEAAVCKLIGGAERTRLSGERLKREMLQVAAQFWQEWDTRGRRTDRAVWVAIRVNKLFGKIRLIHPE